MPTAWDYPRSLSANIGIKWHEVFLYGFLRFLSALIQRTPVSWLDALANLIAWKAFVVLRIRRRLVMSNICTAFGDSLPLADQKRIALASYRNFMKTILEFFHARDTSVTDHCSFVGREIVDQALSQGKGAYILCCHLGNWEVLAAAVNRWVCPVRVVVKKVGGEGTNNFVEERRAAIGMITIKRKGKMDAVRAIREALGQNWLVGFVLDQSRPGEPRLPFFGRDAKTNTSLANLWQRNPAPVIPTFIVRERFDHHTIHFMPPVNLAPSEDRDGDLTRFTVQFNQALESIIRQQPEQYFWLHNRWK